MTIIRRRPGRRIPAVLSALMLALVLGMASGCAGGGEKPVVTDHVSDGGTAMTVTSGDTANNGKDSDNGGGKPIGKPNTVSGSGRDGGDKPTDKPGAVSGSGKGDGVKEPGIVAENKAFRVFEPAEDAVVGTTFTVRGEARVFEAAFSYSFEDGHNTLAEGHVMADKGAPEWGSFEFTVTFEEATSPFGILTLYESGAKDGSPVNGLQIAVKFSEDVVQPISEAETE